MASDLIELTKQKMGYTEVSPACENCKYHTEDDYPSGVSYDVCNYSNVQTFTVSRRGSCKFFKDKTDDNA